MSFYGPWLMLHIVAGALALLLGAGAAVARKGSRAHVGCGRGFAGTMVVTAGSAFVLSLLTGKPFLLVISLFSAYLVVSGWLWGRPLADPTRALAARVSGGIGLAFAGLIFWVGLSGDALNPVLIVFGAILTLMAGLELIRPVAKIDRFRAHGSRMGGAYIAAFTAFLVVNLDSPSLWPWLLPSLLGTPLIVVALRRFCLRPAPTPAA